MPTRYKTIAPMSIYQSIENGDTETLVENLDELKGSYAVKYVLATLLHKDSKETVSGLFEKLDAQLN